MEPQDPPIRLRSPEAPWREVDGQVVVLDPGSWRYVGLGGSAETLWPLIVAGTTHGALVEALLAEFDVDRATADRDVTAFVERLAELELLAEAA